MCDTGGRTGCESNQVAVRRPGAEPSKEEAAAPGRLEGQRELVSYQTQGVRVTCWKM